MNKVHALLGLGLVVLGVNFGFDVHSDVLEVVAGLLGLGAIAVDASDKTRNRV